MEKGALIAVAAIALFLLLSQKPAQASAKPPTSPFASTAGIPPEIDLGRIQNGDFQYFLDVLWRYGPQVIAKIKEWWKAVDPQGYENAQVV